MPIGPHRIYRDHPGAYNTITRPAVLPYNPGAKMVAGQEALLDISETLTMVPSTFSHTDFNYEKPDLKLRTSQQVKDPDRYTAKDYPGGCKLTEQGARALRVPTSSMLCPVYFSPAFLRAAFRIIFWSLNFPY